MPNVNINERLFDPGAGLCRYRTYTHTHTYAHVYISKDSLKGLWRRTEGNIKTLYS